MLERIEYLLKLNESFAIETTLATKSYKNKLIQAKKEGFKVKLLFFWLPSVEMAVNRVATRVSEGGHNIPKEVIERRYLRGIENLFKTYIPLCNEWIVFDNTKSISEKIAEGEIENQIRIINENTWCLFKSKIK